MAIRHRILAVVLALVALALVTLDVVSYNAVRNSLFSSAHSQLSTAAPLFYGQIATFGEGDQAACEGLPAASFAAFYTASGRQVGPVDGCVTAVSAPSLPSSLLTAAEGYATEQVFGTAGSFEVVAHKTDSGVIFVVGEPLKPINSTLGNVLLLELLVSGSILLVVGIAAHFLVKLGFRPLEKMAGTAGEIAAGDLSRRVEGADTRTEVGQLAAALNVMLSRIEEAFRDKEASEARLRRFVADASHELRTPLTSIRGYAELFGGALSAGETDLSAALSRIESESARMSVLIDDLLLLARLDQGRPLEHGRVDLGVLVRDAGQDASVTAPAREISVRTDGELTVTGDEARLRQVLANLVSNAISHTESGTPIELSASRQGDKVRLAVVDHGAGIPPMLRHKVFDRFWRADSSRQRSKGGSGLGLSLVAAIVQSHEGRVAVEETPGGGASIVVELPAIVGLREPSSSWRPLPAPGHGNGEGQEEEGAQSGEAAAFAPPGRTE